MIGAARLLLVLALASGVASVPPARAQPPPGRSDPRPPAPATAPAGPAPPWSVGVSDARKARANALLASGNELLVENRFAAALAQYRLAIAAWDHPAIRANMVVCLINLGRPLEAYENALLALRHGAAPHQKPEVYTATLAYRRALQGQIGTIQFECSDPGARVTLDGQELVVCPGRASRLVQVGRHQVVARRRGSLTMTRDLVVSPGSTETVSVRLVSLADAAITERPSPAWQPWATFGAGVGLVAVGGLLQLQAHANIRRYNQIAMWRCGDEGCPPIRSDAYMRELRDRAERHERLAIGAAAAGGALAIGGLVWVYLNRPRTTLPEGLTLGAGPIGPEATGLVLGGSF